MEEKTEILPENEKLQFLLTEKQFDFFIKRAEARHKNIMLFNFTSTTIFVAFVFLFAAWFITHNNNNIIASIAAFVFLLIVLVVYIFCLIAFVKKRTFAIEHKTIYEIPKKFKEVYFIENKGLWDTSLFNSCYFLLSKNDKTLSLFDIKTERLAEIPIEKITTMKRLSDIDTNINPYYLD